MTSNAKSLNIGDLAKMANDNMLSDVLIKDERNILALIADYNKRLQNASGEEKTNIELHRNMLYNILDGKIEITHSIFAASVKGDTVVQPPQKGNMTVVNKKSPAKANPKVAMENAVVDKFIAENKVIFAPHDELYYELLNIDDFSGILANKELAGTEENKAKLMKAFFGSRQFTDEAIKEWVKVRTEMYPNMTLDDHFVLLYEGSKLTPNKNGIVEDSNALLINTIKGYSDTTGKVSEDFNNDDWEEVEDILTYLLVGTSSKDGKKPRSLNVARNFAKTLIKSVNATDEVVVESKEQVDPTVYTKEAQEQIEAEAETPEVYVVNLVDISEAITNATGNKKTVVKEIVDNFFTDDKGNFVETEIRDDMNEGKVLRYVKKRTAAADFVYKVYAEVQKELHKPAPKVETKVEQTEEKFVEPVIISVNEIKSMGESLIKHGYNLEQLKVWARKHMLNKQLKEQTKGGEFKKEKEVDDIIVAFFGERFKTSKEGITKEEPTIAFDDVKSELVSFIKDEYSKDNTLKVGQLKERATFFLDEKGAKYKVADLINTIKEAAPQLWQKKVKTEQTTETKAETTTKSTTENEVTEATKSFLKARVKERLDNGAKTVAQVKFMLKKQAKADKWEDHVARELVKDPNTNVVNEIFNELTGKVDKPGPVKTKEIKTEAPAVSVEEKPTEEEDDFASDKEESFVVDKFSVRYPEIWEKVKETTTKETLLKNCKIALKRYGEKDSIALFMELRENVNEVKDMNNDEALAFFNDNVLGNKTEKKPTTKVENNEENNPYLSIGKIHDKKKFKQRLAEIFKENEDSQDLRSQLMKAIRNGNGKYVKNLDRGEQTLNTMFDKAKRIAKEEA